jgi:hypothetical protein
MDKYQIEPDGDRFEVMRILPDGKTCFVGRFLREHNAQSWIDSRCAQSREASPSSTRCQ